MTITTTNIPDGIADAHVRPLAGWPRHASPLSLAAFGLVIALALSGVLGHERQWDAQDGGTRLTVSMPETIRNGEFFEMRVEIEAENAIRELTVGIDQALWEDITINTLIPAAADETSETGEFRFAFGELAESTAFLLKVDGQINPDILGANTGSVRVYDGEHPLAEVRVTMTVLP